MWFALVFACTSPDEAAAPALVRPHASEALAVLAGIERLTPGDGFVAGATEVFRAVLTDPSATVGWSATGGALDADGDEVTWTLPGGSTATLTATVRRPGRADEVVDFPIMLIAAPGGATGPVAVGDDIDAEACWLAFDSADTPHIVWLDGRHGGLRYATYSGGAWTDELVDGPGFGVGGIVTGGAIAVDSARVPHVATVREVGQLAYAVRTGGAWTVTELTGSTGGDRPVGLVLDTFNADQPIIAASDTGGLIQIQRKNGANWTRATTFTKGYIGGLVLTAAATVKFTSGGWREAGEVVTWSAQGGFSGARRWDSSIDPLVSHDLVAPNAQTLGVIANEGLLWSTDGGATFETYPLYPDDNEQVSMVWDGAEPRMGALLGTTLELIQQDARRYFTYTLADTGASSSFEPSVAVDSAGDLHACYAKSDGLYFY